MAAARQTCPIRYWLAKDGKTDAAHEPDVNDSAMAETRSAEIDASAAARLRRRDQILPRSWVRQEAEHERLQ